MPANRRVNLGAMADAQSHGTQTLRPKLVVDEADTAVEFYGRVFGASLVQR